MSTDTPHDFNASLAASHAAEDLPIWEEIYRKAFPTMVAMASHRKNGDHQKAGIDQSVILENSKQLLIDEKARGVNRKTGKVYGDILLEYLSDQERGVPGWVCKPMLADYIAYAILPAGKCYLLPVLQLQEAWRQHGQNWIDQYRPPIRAFNETNGHKWTTISVGVPVKTVFMAIGQCLRVEFSRMDFME